MVNVMSRLILVPQYPTKLRYQEWWWEEFPKEFAKYFDAVIVLGKSVSRVLANCGYFSPVELAIQYETQQIADYMVMELKPGDILLLNDLSFPGLFSSVLFHKRPDKCFAICHATSKNAYDYFEKDRRIKYPIEKATAKLFNQIFVGSQYHKMKLGWPNLQEVLLPFAPFEGKQRLIEYNIVTVARPGKQKHNLSLERLITRTFRTPIVQCKAETWDEYYTFLAKSKVLLLTSKEETFGYQVIDAVTNNCIPIAPNKFSYPELLSKNYLYNNVNELIDLVNAALQNEIAVPRLPINDFYARLSFFMKYD
jgi:hypothetical protein